MNNRSNTYGKARRRQWNKLIPRSLSESLQLCKEYAQNTSNMSVPRIADRAQISSDMLYKYLGNGDMPARMLIPYMVATGKHYPLIYMAHSLDFLIVAMPKNKKPCHNSLVQLNTFANQVIGLLIQFQSGSSSGEYIANQIVLLMQELAYHKHEIERLDDPQNSLDLFLDDPIQLN